MIHLPTEPTDDATERISLLEKVAMLFPVLYKYNNIVDCFIFIPVEPVIQTCHSQNNIKYTRFSLSRYVL